MNKKNKLNDWNLYGVNNKPEYACEIKKKTQKYLLEVCELIEREEKEHESSVGIALWLMNVDELEIWDADEWIENKNELINPVDPLSMLFARVRDYEDRLEKKIEGKEKVINKTVNHLWKIQKEMIAEYRVLE